jgi:hypothetical protein
MTDRKRKGITLIITGVGTTVIGGVLLATTATPEWLGIGLAIAAQVANVFGFTVVFPDTE